MLLVIPSIEIKGGKCLQRVRGTSGYEYSDDPIEVAKLWRKENTKALYVTDVDGAIEGRLVNFELIRKMVATVDVPIIIGGGLRNHDAVKAAFEAGAYRVIVSTMCIERPDETKDCLAEFGAGNIVLGIDARKGIIDIRGRNESTGLTAVSLALNAKELGFKRIMYTDILREGTLEGPNFAAIKSLAGAVGMKITISGGIGGLDDLMKLQDFEPLGVDSVVIGRALYENKFSCQALWRQCEAGEYPYTAKV
jgi:phosphoribosylformimino-5-aminoimidazole carboxamide ribotide isomerase